jgi:hypothetical protein
MHVRFDATCQRFRYASFMQPPPPAPPQGHERHTQQQTGIKIPSNNPKSQTTGGQMRKNAILYYTVRIPEENIYKVQHPNAMLLQGRSCPISKATAFRSPSSERGVSRGSHPRSVLPETTNTKHPGGSYTPASFRHAAANRDTLRGKTGAGGLQARQLRAHGQSGHVCWRLGRGTNLDH